MISRITLELAEVAPAIPSDSAHVRCPRSKFKQTIKTAELALISEQAKKLDSLLQCMPSHLQLLIVLHSRVPTRQIDSLPPYCCHHRIGFKKVGVAPLHLVE